ncbi:MAG TPA: ferritin [Bacteroidales bacterium]|jgi:ferritin|nr:ferritin [Bacteroidales bacterium]MDI9532431.1 ferritin [Bacteroidota bacterium]OPZ53908.1 MAG: Ferritin [Bacteroidetes bacterium ADurb.BinA012]MBK7731599.1 ferritin [Bacteroidales bacterium]MBP7035559.1 ferritin [Bacteroidales bacterium]
MLTKKIEDLCNRQIEREGYSSNLYLAMASWAETKGMSGIAEWLYAQAEEERAHMLKFFRYVNERNGTAIVPEFKKPPVKYKGIPELFDEVLKHEKFISASINEVLEAAIADKDYATVNWIQWFVDEQVEEESSAQMIIDKIKLAGEHGIYFLDRDIMNFRGE